MKNLTIIYFNPICKKKYLQEYIFVNNFCVYVERGHLLGNLLLLSECLIPRQTNSLGNMLLLSEDLNPCKTDSLGNLTC